MAFIGIDLGTTTTEACIVRDGRLVMIKNEQGQDIFPSVVGVDPVSRGFIFGESAESLSTDNFKAEVKREMGTNNKIPIGDQLLCPEEVSALILKHIKKIAEKYLGEQVAVIGSLIQHKRCYCSPDFPQGLQV